MNNNELGILLSAKLDLQKTVSQINSDLVKLSQQVKSLNLNIDTSNLTKDINKQVEGINKKSKGIKLETDVTDVIEDFEDAGKVVERLKKQFGATTASIQKDINLADKSYKSWIVTLKKAGEETRKIRLTPYENQKGFTAKEMTVIDDREVQQLKLAEEMAKRREQSLQRQRVEQEKLAQAQAKFSNKAIDDAHKEALAEKEKTDQLRHQLQLAQRQAAIDVQNFRRRYAPVITPEQNKELDNYVASMNNLTATTPNVQRHIQNLNKDFKATSANVAEAGSRVDGFGKQLLVAMQRINR